MIFPGKVDVTPCYSTFAPLSQTVLKQQQPFIHMKVLRKANMPGIRHISAASGTFRHRGCHEDSTDVQRNLWRAGWQDWKFYLPWALREAKNSTKRSKHVQSCPCLPCKNDGKWWKMMKHHETLGFILSQFILSQFIYHQSLSILSPNLPPGGWKQLRCVRCLCCTCKDSTMSKSDDLKNGIRSW